MNIYMIPIQKEEIEHSIHTKYFVMQIRNT